MSGSSIEPEVSIRKTRFDLGFSWPLSEKPLMAICMSLVSGFHGVGKTETEALNGSVLSTGVA